MRFQIDTIIRNSSVLLRTSMFSSPSSPSSLNLWHPHEKLSLCVGRLLQASATLRDGGGSALGSRLSLLSRRAALICQTVLTPIEAEEQRSSATPLDHRCGRVAKLALERRRVQQRCPRAPTPEPGKGRRPKIRQSQRRKVFLPGCFVFSLSWPACAGAFLFPGRWFSGPAPSGSCLFFVPPDVSFYWPRASRSSSQREGRRVKCRGTDPRTGPF